MRQLTLTRKEGDDMTTDIRTLIGSPPDGEPIAELQDRKSVV